MFDKIVHIEESDLINLEWGWKTVLTGIPVVCRGDYSGKFWTVSASSL